jgi:hypothetical protein
LTRHYTTCSIYQQSSSEENTTPAASTNTTSTASTAHRFDLQEFEVKKKPIPIPLKIPKLSNKAHENFKARDFLNQRKRIRLPQPGIQPIRVTTKTPKQTAEDNSVDTADLPTEEDYSTVRSAIVPLNRQSVEAITKEIASTLEVDIPQVRKTLQLLAKGCTLPFIVRYRQEETGGLNETAVGYIIKR